MLRKVELIGNADLSEDIKRQIRVEFRNNSAIADPGTRNALLKEGLRQLKAIEALGISENSPDSWVNTFDNDDKRGRIGSGWPWGRN